MTTPDPTSCLSPVCPDLGTNRIPGTREGCLSPVPPPYGGTDTPSPTNLSVPRLSEQQDKHPTQHLIQAAEIARITGDAPGTLALLLTCPRCFP